MIVLTDLLPPALVQALLEQWRGYPGFALSSDGGSDTGPVVASSARNRPARTAYREGSRHLDFAPSIGQRADATVNYVRSGGRLGHAEESEAALHARTDYLRATYVAGRNIFAPALVGLLQHPALAEAARGLYGRPIVLPSQIYANVMLPGQELGVHTDVPEFRGANRGRYPMWLLVVMHHSGLFEPWRIHLATAVLHLGHTAGGEFAHYPSGPAGAAVTEAPRHNQALVLDTDSTFHGVDRVLGDERALARLRPGVRLRHRNGAWRLDSAEQLLWSFGEDELRYSVSWKAQCLADRAELDAIESHEDDLEFAQVLATLTAALDDPSATRLSDHELARRLIERFVPFPEPVRRG
jgi:hypothetical protein